MCIRDSINAEYGGSQKYEMATEQEVVEDFKALLEKSQSFFNGLRDLPQYENKQWKMFYEKTFEVYTQLWKYQQAHRAVLEDPAGYGLKRWQIGEIASKIGQLYYHYYLRTSDGLYLQESFVFYEAIKSRGYFDDLLEQHSTALVVKMLRYQARFALVSLLLDRREMAREACDALEQHSAAYARVFDAPPDAAEWAGVSAELRAFLAAGENVRVCGQQHLPAVPLYQGAPPEAGPPVAVLVGAKAKQIRFSEMPLELFRLSTAMEAGSEQGVVCPEKHLMFCPSFDKLLVTLASVNKERPAHTNQALLLYVCADTSEEHSDGRAGLALGEHGVLYPEDLHCVLRRPLCAVLDSPAASCFAGLSSPFNQACVLLLAPAETPAQVPGPEVVGSLFTLFLSHPLQALATACCLQEVQPAQHTDAQKALSAVMGVLHGAMQAAHELHPWLHSMLADPVLCNLLLRCALFQAVARVHAHFSGSAAFMPSISPGLPEELLHSEAVAAGVQALGAALGTPLLQPGSI
eukprot:TRINITY_DN3330_c0_g1_i2.p1 TRINITY_DN3330_c0_g1~~TRINITY_DN3330_c0_g1_i2.p1  ORF type:complete len:520 (+),score=186.41 TRINITY_DN3330_c0_g1_i2:139-1698(+)